MYLCNLCSSEFTQKGPLNRHLRERRCKITNDLLELNNLIESFKYKNHEVKSNIQTNNGTVNNGNVINISIVVNPVNKLMVEYLEPEKMKKLVESYTNDNSNLLLSEYIKDIIHNKDHPENQCVKYLTKRPPTYSNTIEKEGEKVNVIKNLKDSCELLSEPVLATLREKLKECNKAFKSDQDFQSVYEDTVREIYRELNKDVVKTALKSVLQNNILNDIEMKISAMDFT
jgi:hypothetical protein